MFAAVTGRPPVPTPCTCIRGWQRSVLGTLDAGPYLTGGIRVASCRRPELRLNVNSETTWMEVRGGVAADRMPDTTRPRGYLTRETCAHCAFIMGGRVHYSCDRPSWAHIGNVARISDDTEARHSAPSPSRTVCFTHSLNAFAPISTPSPRPPLVSRSSPSRFERPLPTPSSLSLKETGS